MKIRISFISAIALNKQILYISVQYSHLPLAKNHPIKTIISPNFHSLMGAMDSIMFGKN